MHGTERGDWSALLRAGRTALNVLKSPPYWTRTSGRVLGLQIHRPRVPQMFVAIWRPTRGLKFHWERCDVPYLRPRPLLLHTSSMAFLMEAEALTSTTAPSLPLMAWTSASARASPGCWVRTAGKSTAIKLFLGLIKPTSGSAQVLGGRLYESIRIRSRLGYMPETAVVKTLAQMCVPAATEFQILTVSDSARCLTLRSVSFLIGSAPDISARRLL